MGLGFVTNKKKKLLSTIIKNFEEKEKRTKHLTHPSMTVQRAEFLLDF